MVERIAQGLRDRAGPGEELVVGGCIAGDEVFGGASAAHGTPFVVVAFEPDVKEVGELAVGCDVLRWEMVVVIVNGLIGGVLMVEAALCRGVHEEIVVDEGHGFGVFQVQCSRFNVYPARLRLAGSALCLRFG